MQHLSWTLGTGTESRGGHGKTTDWAEVAAHLEAVVARGGTVTLETTGDAPWRSLQLQSEAGCCLLTLTYDEGEVRMLDSGDPTSEEVEILGDLWSASAVTRDAETVTRVFQTFFSTGDVPLEWMA